MTTTTWIKSALCALVIATVCTGFSWVALAARPAPLPQCGREKCPQGKFWIHGDPLVGRGTEGLPTT